MRRFTVALALACLPGLGCSASKPAPADAGMNCDCTGRICGTLCGRVCGVCPNDGVCTNNGTMCMAALPIGSPCTTDIECGDGRTCVTTAKQNAPNGYCTAPCGTGITCPDNAVCATGTDGTSTCLAACSASMPCRTSDGYQCNAQGFCPACVPQCTPGACGDDGCGGQCGQTSPSTPVCNTDNQICSNKTCTTAFTPSGNLADSSNAMAFTYGLFDAAAFDIDGYAVIVGGREVYQYPNGKLGAVSLASVVVFDPAQNKVTNVWPPMVDSMNNPVAVAKPQAAVVDNVLYVAGGISDPMAMPSGGETFESNDTPQAVFLKYNGMQMGNAVWNANIAQVPAPFPENGALVPLSSNGLLYLIGGEINGKPTTRVDAYSPLPIDKWNSPNMPPQRALARTRFAAVTDGLRIYVIGGWDGSQALGTVEIFDGSTWSKAIDLPQPVVDATAVVANNGKIYVFGGKLSPGPYGTVVGEIQSIDLTTHQTAVIGMTDHELAGQTPVALRTGEILLFGALNFDSTGTTPVADAEVLRFNIPK